MLEDNQLANTQPKQDNTKINVGLNRDQRKAMKKNARF